MKLDKDIIALTELLKMAAKRWPHSDREIPQSDSFHRGRSCSKCGRKPAGALASAAETFRQAQ
jgi:hypothetical protein